MNIRKNFTIIAYVISLMIFLHSIFLIGSNLHALASMIFSGEMGITNSNAFNIRLGLMDLLVPCWLFCVAVIYLDEKIIRKS